MSKKYTKKERIAKFWSRVQIKGLLDCWEWTGAKEPRDYGHTQGTRGENTRAHRLSWELTYGVIADDMYVCHKCDNPPCCNPVHLYLGTPKENAQDRDRRKRRRPPKGIDNGRAKLKESDIKEIRSLIAQGITQTVIAKKYGICRGGVSKIKLGKSWSHINQ